jgi:hypothetical protein
VFFQVKELTPEPLLYVDNRVTFHQERANHSALCIDVGW